MFAQTISCAPGCVPLLVSVQFLVVTEDAHRVLLPALTLKVRFDPRRLLYARVQLHQLGVLGFEFGHPLRERKLEPVDDLEQAQVGIGRARFEQVVRFRALEVVFEVFEEFGQARTAEIGSSSLGLLFLVLCFREQRRQSGRSVRSEAKIAHLVVASHRDRMVSIMGFIV